MSADTASCVEKTQDCEEFVKAEIKKLVASAVRSTSKSFIVHNKVKFEI